jgi:4'-phosphopantetheinyl transferase
MKGGNEDLTVKGRFSFLAKPSTMTEKSSNIVKVLYAFFDKRLTEASWEKHFRMLAKETQTRIMRYRRWEDRHARLFGSLLLMACFRIYGYEDAVDTLNHISVSENGRPLLEGGIDFNISHSGGYVVCAASRDARVGIDIERMKPIELLDFKESFTPNQWDKIEKAPDALTTFYMYWTAKESVLKADGRGIAISLRAIDIFENYAKLQGRAWLVKEIRIDPEYCCHLALSKEECDVQVREVSIDDEDSIFDQNTSEVPTEKRIDSTLPSPRLTI